MLTELHFFNETLATKTKIKTSNRSIRAMIDEPAYTGELDQTLPPA